MPPEQIRAWTIDARTDVYALGVVLYRALADAWPFDETDATSYIEAMLTDAPTPLAAHAPQVSASIRDIVMKCIERDPDARFVSATSLRDALRMELRAMPEEEEPVLASQRSPASAARKFAAASALPNRTRRSARRNLLVAFAVIAASLVVVASFGIMRRNTPRAPTKIDDSPAYLSVVSRPPPTAPTPTVSASARTPWPPSPSIVSDLAKPASVVASKPHAAPRMPADEDGNPKVLE